MLELGPVTTPPTCLMLLKRVEDRANCNPGLACSEDLSRSAAGHELKHKQLRPKLHSGIVTLVTLML